MDFSLIKIVVGAIVTWLLVIFMNETYKEVLKESGLPQRLAKYFHRVVRRKSLASAFLVRGLVSQPEQAVAKSEYELLDDRSMSRWFVYPATFMIYTTLYYKYGQMGSFITVFILGISAISLISAVIFESIVYLQLSNREYGNYSTLREHAMFIAGFPVFISMAVLVVVLFLLAIGATVFVVGYMVYFISISVMEYAGRA